MIIGDDFCSYGEVKFYDESDLKEGRVKICSLDEQVTTCSFWCEQLCNNPGLGCGFIKIVDEEMIRLRKSSEPIRQHKEYVRKPRWYEKYYR